jgi:hypothetical protein
MFATDYRQTVLYRGEALIVAAAVFIFPILLDKPVNLPSIPPFLIMKGL